MIASVETQSTRDALHLLRAGLHQAAQLGLKETVKIAVDDAKATTLWKDQRPLTRSTIRGQVGQGKATLIAGGASRLLEQGTPPHLITAVNGRALRFMVNGHAVFRRYVNHPGTAERPFLTQARDHAAAAAPFAFEVYAAYAIEHAR